MTDLVVLVSDQAYEKALEGLLPRHPALGIPHRHYLFSSSNRGVKILLTSSVLILLY